jgi:hypothetical protein
MLLELEPCPMTPAVMKTLEEKGLIIRLCPGNHSAVTKPNQSNNVVIYSSDPKNGPHKLIVATIDAFDASLYFGTHVENEEFLFIGDPATKPLYLVVALCKRSELIEKIKNNRLMSQDFVALRVKFNDPEVSFFVMLKDVPHGEVTVNIPGTCASFYVTEPRDILIDSIDLQGYTLQVKPEPIPA